MSKISDLSDGGSLQSTDFLVAVRAGGNVKVQADGNLSLGTVTANGLTVEGTSPKIFLSETDKTDLNARVRSSNGFFQVQSVDDSDANPVTRFQIEHATGDISFYEDTGTTAKFFWDASAEALGINDTSPARRLSINSGGVQIAARFESTSSTSARISLVDANTTADNYVSVASSGDALALYAGAAERFRITSGGNVGIGTTSPATRLELSGVKDTSELRLSSTTNDASWAANQYFGKLSFYSADSSGAGAGIKGSIVSACSGGSSGATAHMAFSVASTTANEVEAMRIDSSGNLLVEKTASDTSSAGHELRSGSFAAHTVDGDVALNLRRLNSDGDIARFQKGGITVGSIGSYSNSYLYIGSEGGTDTHIAFVNGSVRPSTNDGSLLDNVLDLGNASARWDDVFATNGTIQTSDANEKQDIAELDEAERRVAVAAKGLLRKFRWKSSVEAKGDDARIHFGIIAQDLQAAFEAEGLDAGRYAMFIHSTWTDEETGEERSRMGVRYSELLAFIIAAL